MRTTIVLKVCLLFVSVVPILADVNVPRGYYLVNLTENDVFNRWCNINDHGQIVWYTCLDPFNGSTCEIMTYEDGQVRQITNNNVADGYPDINDAGQIVWSSATGPGGVLEIWLYENGLARKIQDESLQESAQDNFDAQISNAGVVVWPRRSPNSECNSAEAEIWMYDGQESYQLTDLGDSNQMARINSAGEVVWTHYNFCVQPWQSQIMLLRNGVIEVISPAEQVRPTGAAISDVGRIFWRSAVDTPYEDAVSVWENGVVSEFTAWGSGGRVSDDGTLGINRWFESNQTWQVVIARNDQFTQLTDDPFWNADPAPNSRGEVAWTYGDFPVYQNRAILRFSVGDLNCDHQTGLGDISAFVLAVTQPVAYDESHPICDATLADVNADGVVTVSDIAGFVSLLLSQ